MQLLRVVVTVQGSTVDGAIVETSSSITDSDSVAVVTFVGSIEEDTKQKSCQTLYVNLWADRHWYETIVRFVRCCWRCLGLVVVTSLWFWIHL